MLAHGQEWLLVEPGNGGSPWRLRWRLRWEPGDGGRKGGWAATKVAWEAGRDGGSRRSLATVSCVGGWLRSPVTEVTKEARGLATVGHEGGLTTAAMDGQSVATKVAMLAFMTEGNEEAAQRWVAKEAAATEGHGIAWQWRSRWRLVVTVGRDRAWRWRSQWRLIWERGD